MAQDSARTLHLGCSDTHSSYRQLAMTVCQDGHLFCWHQCLSLDAFQVNQTFCQDYNLDLACINPRRQLWDYTTHGDFFPGCVDVAQAENHTALPALPDYPRNESACDEFAAFVVQGSSYDHQVNLTDRVVFQWRLRDGSRVQGRLVHDGLLGWLGLGFRNPGGDKNGM